MMNQFPWEAFLRTLTMTACHTSGQNCSSTAVRGGARRLAYLLPSDSLTLQEVVLAGPVASGLPAFLFQYQTLTL